MKYMFLGLVLVVSFLNVGCSEAGASDEPAKAGSFTCEIQQSEVKWFWGEICPIGAKEKWVSVGNSYSGNAKTTGCVQQRIACTMTR